MLYSIPPLLSLRKEEENTYSKESRDWVLHSLCVRFCSILEYLDIIVILLFNEEIKLILFEFFPLCFGFYFSHWCLQSRVKQEGMRREYLCSTIQTKRKDKNFNSTSKMECSICYFDLHLSAVHCSCSSDRYSCLNHAKRLCSCTWTEKIFLYNYEISELNILVEAVEGTLSAVHTWAREDLNLGLRRYTPREKSFREDKGKKEHKLQDAVTSYGDGLSAVSSIKAEIKTRLQQLQCLPVQKSKEEMVSTPSLPRVTQDDTSLLLREVMPEDLSSSSSESDDTTDLDLDDGGNECLVSTLSSRPSPSQPASEREVTLSQRRRPSKREVALSELLKDNSSKHGTAEHFKSTSEGLPMSHPASKKRKKK